jgi:hypothetical protein
VSLTVRNVERDGTPRAVERDTAVRLRSNGFAIDPSSVTLPAGSFEATEEVRARGLGTVQIQADNGDSGAAPVDITFVAPIAFLIATLLGGVAGGHLSASSTRKKSPRKRIRYAAQLIEGALVGLVTVSALLVFSSLTLFPAWARSSVLGWALASALAGFLGTELIDRVAQRVFGKAQAKQLTGSAA